MAWSAVSYKSRGAHQGDSKSGSKKAGSKSVETLDRGAVIAALAAGFQEACLGFMEARVDLTLPQVRQPYSHPFCIIIALLLLFDCYWYYTLIVSVTVIVIYFFRIYNCSVFCGFVYCYCFYCSATRELCSATHGVSSEPYLLPRVASVTLSLAPREGCLLVEHW
jgi:hypothetical protein